MKHKTAFKNLPKIQAQRFRKLRLEKEQELAKRIVSPHRKRTRTGEDGRVRYLLADQRGAHGRT